MTADTHTPFRGKAWLWNFPLGLTLGVCFAFSFSGLIDADVWASAKDTYLPALLTTCATLTSATVAVSGVLRGIQNQNILADAARKRKLLAARATLPLALSELYKLAEKQIIRHANVSQQADHDFVQMSGTAQETLKLVIEHANAPTQKSLSFLLMAYQILQARHLAEASDQESAEAKTEAERILSKHRQASNIIAWAAFKALVSAQYEFARNGSECEGNKFAKQLFEHELEHCSSDGGWLLVNDGFFRERFEAVIRDPKHTFLNPDYFSGR